MKFFDIMEGFATILLCLLIDFLWILFSYDLYKTGVISHKYILYILSGIMGAFIMQCSIKFNKLIFEP